MCVTAASPHGVQALSAVLIQAQLKKREGEKEEEREEEEGVGVFN